MAWIMPEIVIRKIIDLGIKQLRSDKPAFDELFSTLTSDELGPDYGQSYVDDIWNWFTTTKVPVVQAWSFNAQRIPCISVHLANETEDESKAAFNDLAADLGPDGDLGTGVFTVMVDLGIHANKAGDHVLWLYYIVSYILFKNKMMADRLGLRLHTYSASDYSKNSEFMGNNIWTRWIRFRCTTQNFWGGDTATEIVDVNVETAIGLTPATSVATSLDVGAVDTTANDGLKVSRAGDPDDDEDLNI